jgi:hypothetical protein
MPLLSWGSQHIGGAVISAMLATDHVQLPSATKILQAARILLFGRIIQSVVTPDGCGSYADVVYDELLDFWSDEELKSRMILRYRL